MTELEKGPTGRRRGRGARERILSASQQLFREQGINRTGMDQLCAAAEVSKRTAYQHFTNKDELVAEYLRRFDPSVLPGVFDRTDLTPRERLLAVFDIPHHPPVPLHRRRRRTERPPAPRIPVRTRLQESRRRAVRRRRPRSRRRRPRTTRRAARAAPRRRRGPHPGPRRRRLPHCRRHRRRPHRQRHPRHSRR
ncbi:TetR/AcrR family transcriptional regulator [Streptomyces mexicanus]